MSVEVPLLRFLGQNLDKKFFADGFGILSIKLFSEPYRSNSHPCPTKSPWFFGC